jgi:alpha/beta superfamily hydrolase
VTIPVAHGSLEGILREPTSAVAAAVVCHPHPRGGGTMNNNVVYRAAKALVAGGVIALRFNFRGVGASTGAHADGVGEEEDVRAAIEFLRAHAPGLPIWIAGFSFGARVGLTVGAQSDDVVKLLGIGLALQMFDYRFLASCPKPKAIVQASHDEYGGREAIEEAVRGMSEPRRLWVVDGASHLFPGHLDAFERAAEEAVTYLKATGG